MGQLKRLQPAADASVLSENLQTYDLTTVRFAPATRQLYGFPTQTNMRLLSPVLKGAPSGWLAPESFCLACGLLVLPSYSGYT